MIGVVDPKMPVCELRDPAMIDGINRSAPARLRALPVAVDRFRSNPLGSNTPPIQRTVSWLLVFAVTENLQELGIGMGTADVLGRTGILARGTDRQR